MIIWCTVVELWLGVKKTEGYVDKELDGWGTEKVSYRGGCPT